GRADSVRLDGATKLALHAGLAAGVATRAGVPGVVASGRLRGGPLRTVARGRHVAGGAAGPQADCRAQGNTMGRSAHAGAAGEAGGGTWLVVSGRLGLGQ